ncbi:hypothetical protein EOT10_28855 [Streptomyces antnestii]|uniref:DUF3558 domain-containing protein n=1 Tax=Streptomyces antnestii TaxID=2494256 RepID=A0A437PCP8_9ACTN|nr:hypothetical protein [Streptomyces sp. San01]RVU20010.1 hypothetical protein EOT10_28855 [Streptomyces sp. San01]
MFRSRWLCLTALAGVGLLAGCGEEKPPPPVEFGTARPAGDTLGLQPPQGAAMALSQWPDACKLVTDGELRAFLPQAKNVERKPVKVSIINFDPMADAKPGTTGDVPRGGCEFAFNLPGNGGDHVTSSNFTVTVTALADPALVSDKYREDKGDDASEQGFKDLAGSWGAQACYSVDGVVGDKVTCMQGPYEFELDGSSYAEGLVRQPGPDAKPSENLAAAAERKRLWTDKVLSQAARTVAARMS